MWEDERELAAGVGCPLLGTKEEGGTLTECPRQGNPDGELAPVVAGPSRPPAASWLPPGPAAPGVAPGALDLAAGRYRLSPPGHSLAGEHQSAFHPASAANSLGPVSGDLLVAV